MHPCSRISPGNAPGGTVLCPRSVFLDCCAKCTAEIWQTYSPCLAHASLLALSDATRLLGQGLSGSACKIARERCVNVAQTTVRYSRHVRKSDTESQSPTTAASHGGCPHSQPISISPEPASLQIWLQYFSSELTWQLHDECAHFLVVVVGIFSSPVFDPCCARQLVSHGSCIDAATEN